MSKTMPFLLYCIEEYRYAHNLKGAEVIDLFNKYHICEYINECYEALHTTGTEYIINDIDTYIANNKITD